MSDDSRRTIEAYDCYAARYADITRQRLAIGDEALQRFVAEVGAGARVLEVASGPGWDADELEARGLEVRRTDLSEGFIALQRARGRSVDRLDLITDEFGGPWDGLVALYVLQHVARDRLDAVTGRIFASLREGGVLLTSFQEGDGECEQAGSEGGAYHVVQWPPQDVLRMLAGHGFEVVWRHSFQGSEARWTILMARRP